MAQTNDPTLSLSDEAISLIQESHSVAASVMPQVVENFYSRLFTRHPALRAMFPSDMNRQREHLTIAIALVARNASRLDLLSEPLRQLGARHVAYGAKADHYPVVRDLMLESLAEVLGGAWTPLHHRAWHGALTAVAAVMLTGAADYERAVKQQSAAADGGSSHAVAEAGLPLERHPHTLP